MLLNTKASASVLCW